MAKVKLSAIVSDMRNKLNGSVFARNRGGLYLRTKVTPVNPQTVAQQAARNNLTSFSQGWRSLTEAQRDSWNAAVGNFATTDIFGDLRNPSGINLYNRLNINITNGGGAPITTPPVPTGAPAVDSVVLAANATGGTYTVTFTPDPIPADTAMIVESTAALSPGISNASAEYRIVATFAAGTTGAQDIAAAQIAKFGALIAGQKYFVRVKQVNLLTGEVSQTLISESIAV